ncbi:MAG: hypothetical protein QOH25_4083 [Acidobacteriota bacterium]|jgi:hypothetical protein|nr:hypothetical protein [Acidobacteriota bacterium]
MFCGYMSNFQAYVAGFGLSGHLSQTLEACYFFEFAQALRNGSVRACELENNSVAGNQARNLFRVPNF